MIKIRVLTGFLLLVCACAPLQVCAAEVNENNNLILEEEMAPRALITNVNVKKRSESGDFEVKADIVTNDGTRRIIDIKNISLSGWPSKLDGVQIILSSGEIWSNGEYATVIISYWYNGKQNTDIVTYYPNGN